MAKDVGSDDKRNFTVLRGQGTFSTIAWTMANPSVVLSYLAISLDVPVIIAGLLVTVRQAACLMTSLFGTAIAAERRNKKRDIAITDVVVALCFVMILGAVALGPSQLATFGLILAVLIIGLTSEYQNILSTDFYGNVLDSEARTRLFYSVMTLGGAATAVLVVSAHLLFQDSPALTRHSVVITMGIVCFLTASIVLMLVREYSALADEVKTPAQRPARRFSLTNQVRKIRGNFVLLIGMDWFRKYLVVRLSLLTVELSVPFYAILAALHHNGSPQGLTELLVSSALGLVVAGPLWQAVGYRSTRTVMIAGASMATIAGAILIFDHFFTVVSFQHIHAVALFIVMVAVKGVSTARSLYFMDLAPERYRVIGIGVSKTVVRTIAIGLSFVLATIAHLQHVIWAIALVAVINGIAAYLVYRISALTEPTADAAARS